MNNWSPGQINLPPGQGSSSGSGSSDVRSSGNGNNDDVKIIDTRSSDVTIRVCRPTECVEVTARHAAIASG